MHKTVAINIDTPAGIVQIHNNNVTNKCSQVHQNSF